jgi:hypothetical protein
MALCTEGRDGMEGKVIFKPAEFSTAVSTSPSLPHIDSTNVVVSTASATLTTALIAVPFPSLVVFAFESFPKELKVSCTEIDAQAKFDRESQQNR